MPARVLRLSRTAPGMRKKNHAKEWRVQMDMTYSDTYKCEDGRILSVNVYYDRDTCTIWRYIGIRHYGEYPANVVRATHYDKTNISEPALSLAITAYEAATSAWEYARFAGTTLTETSRVQASINANSYMNVYLNA